MTTTGKCGVCRIRDRDEGNKCCARCRLRVGRGNRVGIRDGAGGECECGAARLPGLEGCARCHELDGHGRASFLISALRALGGAATIEQLIEQMAPDCERTVRRAVAEMRAAGRLVARKVQDTSPREISAGSPFARGKWTQRGGSNVQDAGRVVALYAIIDRAGGRP